MNSIQRITLMVLLWAAPFFLGAQAFTEVPSISNSLIGLVAGNVAWGDYDNDGDLDILVTGMDAIAPHAKVYRNDAGAFVDIQAGLSGITFGVGSWGDCDNDGDLDILCSGQDANGQGQSRLYRNEGGIFVNAQSAFVETGYGDGAWGDYDNDGDQDILLTGDYINTGIGVSVIYRNDSGIYTGIYSVFGMNYSSVAWGDYDSDGDLDIAISGEFDGSLSISQIYRNDGGNFSDIGANLPGVVLGSHAWGDCDQDGDLDLLLTGYDGSDGISAVYRNDAGTFVDLNANLVGVYAGTGAWGDYDNDGDLDILLAGTTVMGPATRIYRNNGGSFSNSNIGLAAMQSAAAAWGDYDNDRDLDILISGADVNYNAFTKVYRNNSTSANTAPLPPLNLTATVQADTAIHFTWAAGSDATTPVAGLSYRLWIGTAPDSLNVSSPMADTATGWRMIAAMGNVQGTSWTLDNVTAGETYFACVSAIDAGFMGSACSGMRSFLVGMQEEGGLEAFTVSAGPNPTKGNVHVAFEHGWVAGKTRYALTDVGGQCLEGYSGVMGAELDLDLTGLAAGVYLLRLEGGQFKGVESIRILKI